jgi:uncharacterized membrane protein YphA (DoxX/SURF4 family)
VTGHRRRVATIATLLALYAVPLGDIPRMWNANEMSRLLLAVAVAERGTIQLDGVIGAYGAEPQDMALRNGHAYSDKAPGLSLLSVPAVWAFAIVGSRFVTGDAPDYWPLRHLLTFLTVSLPLAVFLGVVTRPLALAAAGLDVIDEEVVHRT